MALIAIGGSVGAGLFIGSGAVIQTAGPAAVVSYVLAGALVFFTLRALGEMVVAVPTGGSFSDHARLAFGPRGGFTIGWLYWWMYAVLVAAESVAGAAILAQWVALPGWVLALLVLVSMTVANLISVKVFAETESAFSLIKVATIVAFLLVGVLWALGLWTGSDAPGLSNLFDHGGFVPHGWVAVLAATVVVLFAFGGVEIITVAAGESAEPERGVASAVTNVLWRIGLFYVASILVIVVVLPWDSVVPGYSPFVSVMDHVGIPGSALIMEIVVFIAVLSVLNAALYTSSRMLFMLTRQGDAPKVLRGTNRRGVPVRAILLGTAVGYVAVVVEYMFPDEVFPFLVASIGAILLVLFITICASQLVLGARVRRLQPHRLTLRMWAFPYLTWVVLLGLVTIGVAMAVIPDQRQALWATLASVVVALLAYEVRRRVGRRAPSVVALPVPGRESTDALRRGAPVGEASSAPEPGGGAGSAGSGGGGSP
ncbi:amino acid permease [Nocardiopsis sp. HNM0947]|uniref:Amino acid permease n=1 Tax=Nocardiopsis coralli TaxID=2772213 RepID=A0ABR9P6I0_9ACTN|nr:amino acid permease [Nocardiopsis coralli]MBE2999460.1 amino acid permease [Nocardiopsis coralli]